MESSIQIPKQFGKLVVVAKYDRGAAEKRVDDRVVEPLVQAFFDDPVCADPGLSKTTTSRIVEQVWRIRHVRVEPAQRWADLVGVAEIEGCITDAIDTAHAAISLSRFAM